MYEGITFKPIVYRKTIASKKVESGNARYLLPPVRSPAVLDNPVRLTLVCNTWLA